MHEPRATIAVFSRLSIAAEVTEVVPEPTPDVPGALSLLIMTLIKCMAGAEEEEVRNKLKKLLRLQKKEK